MLDEKIITNINQQSPNKKETALHFACRNDHLDVIQFLVNKGADVNVKGISIVILISRILAFCKLFQSVLMKLLYISLKFK